MKNLGESIVNQKTNNEISRKGLNKIIIDPDTTFEDLVGKGLIRIMYGTGTKDKPAFSKFLKN